MINNKNIKDKNNFSVIRVGVIYEYFQLQIESPTIPISNRTGVARRLQRLNNVLQRFCPVEGLPAAGHITKLTFATLIMDEPLIRTSQFYSDSRYWLTSQRLVADAGSLVKKNSL